MQIRSYPELVEILQTMSQDPTDETAGGFGGTHNPLQGGMVCDKCKKFVFQVVLPFFQGPHDCQTCGSELRGSAILEKFGTNRWYHPANPRNL
ncbi:hypothetical protein ROHU_033488 [Labeo rohita]|uniref:Uncharacterized protein n=1 Tax=Labeo rohita TaxID=84645 RepID=A0A498LD73_LABRO|nr:hypothetical protein ROHU_033488 [Labeo rohita]